MLRSARHKVSQNPLQTALRHFSKVKLTVESESEVKKIVPRHYILLLVIFGSNRVCWLPITWLRQFYF